MAKKTSSKGVVKEPQDIPCLILCNINQAVFWVTPISLDNCNEVMPFLWEVINHTAVNQSQK
jgi:hypothetical protein